MAQHDVIVIGGGSAGTAAASAASRAGADTLMINDGELGGLCILRGCMPTKAMLASAHALHETTQLDPFGVRLEGRAVPDFARIMARKDAQVDRFQKAKIRGIEADDYEVRFGRARFVPGGAVEVDGERLTAGAYVIAVGSVAVELPLPGIDDVRVLTSDTVMSLTEQPESLVVQGGGPIGLELAQFFARIGTRVVLVNRSPLLCKFDPEAGEELTRALSHEENLELVVPGKIEQLRRDGAGLIASIRAGNSVAEHRADALLLAVGRRAAFDDLGLEHVELDGSSGRLEHDETMRTTHPQVFIAGDATGTFQILHLGTQEGRIAGENAARMARAAGAAGAAGGSPRRMDYRLKMQVIFTDPPYAQVGLDPEEARREGIDAVTGTARFPETGRAITMETRHGLWKVLASRNDGRILGTSILGPRGDDLAHLISTLMHFDGRVADLEQLPWYHPTLSEVLIDITRDLRRQFP